MQRRNTSGTRSHRNQKKKGQPRDNREEKGQCHDKAGGKQSNIQINEIKAKINRIQKQTNRSGTRHTRQ